MNIKVRKGPSNTYLVLPEVDGGWIFVRKRNKKARVSGVLFFVTVT